MYKLMKKYFQATMKHYIVSIIIILALAVIALGIIANKQMSSDIQVSADINGTCVDIGWDILVADIGSTECDALIEIYNSTDGANWTTKTGWIEEDPTCAQLDGITCAGNHVTAIDFENNNLQGDLTSSIEDFSGLIDLVLSSNSLTSVPTEIWNLSSLTTISLNYNQTLTSLPSVSVNNVLLNLNVYYSGLTSLPSTINNLTALDRLQAHNNSITSLPTTIWSLPSLTYLRLGDNLITNFPSVSSANAVLEFIGLNDNSLTVLPDNIDNLDALIRLYLGNNSLTALPNNFVLLSNLDNLNISNNQISSLPANFDSLTLLTTLDISGNPVGGGEIPTDIITLSATTNILRTLTIGDSSMSSWPSNLGNLNLTNFGLANSNMTNIGGIDVLTALGTIGHVILRNNPLLTNITNINDLAATLINLGIYENDTLTDLTTNFWLLDNLQNLIIDNNKKLISFPAAGILNSLSNLSIENGYFTPGGLDGKFTAVAFPALANLNVSNNCLYNIGSGAYGALNTYIDGKAVAGWDDYINQNHCSSDCTVTGGNITVSTLDFIKDDGMACTLDSAVDIANEYDGDVVIGFSDMNGKIELPDGAIINMGNRNGHTITLSGNIDGVQNWPKIGITNNKKTNNIIFIKDTYYVSSKYTAVSNLNPGPVIIEKLSFVNGMSGAVSIDRYKADITVRNNWIGKFQTEDFTTPGDPNDDVYGIEPNIIYGVFVYDKDVGIESPSSRRITIDENTLEHVVIGISSSGMSLDFPTMVSRLINPEKSFDYVDVTNNTLDITGIGIMLGEDNNIDVSGNTIENSVFSGIIDVSIVTEMMNLMSETGGIIRSNLSDIKDGMYDSFIDGVFDYTIENIEEIAYNMGVTELGMNAIRDILAFETFTADIESYKDTTKANIKADFDSKVAGVPAMIDMNDDKVYGTMMLMAFVGTIKDFIEIIPTDSGAWDSGSGNGWLADQFNDLISNPNSIPGYEKYATLIPADFGSFGVFTGLNGAVLAERIMTAYGSGLQDIVKRVAEDVFHTIGSEIITELELNNMFTLFGNRNNSITNNTLTSNQTGLMSVGSSSIGESGTQNTFTGNTDADMVSIFPLILNVENNIFNGNGTGKAGLIVMPIPGVPTEVTALPGYLKIYDITVKNNTFNNHTSIGGLVLDYEVGDYSGNTGSDTPYPFIQGQYGAIEIRDSLGNIVDDRGTLVPTEIKITDQYGFELDVLAGQATVGKFSLASPYSAKTHSVSGIVDDCSDITVGFACNSIQAVSAAIGDSALCEWDYTAGTCGANGATPFGPAINCSDFFNEKFPRIAMRLVGMDVLSLSNNTLIDTAIDVFESMTPMTLEIWSPLQYSDVLFSSCTYTATPASNRTEGVWGFQNGVINTLTPTFNLYGKLLVALYGAGDDFDLDEFIPFDFYYDFPFTWPIIPNYGNNSSGSEITLTQTISVKLDDAGVPAEDGTGTFAWNTNIPTPEILRNTFAAKGIPLFNNLLNLGRAWNKVFPMSFYVGTCGNGYVDTGEQCDNGKVCDDDYGYGNGLFYTGGYNVCKTDADCAGSCILKETSECSATCTNTTCTPGERIMEYDVGHMVNSGGYYSSPVAVGSDGIIYVGTNYDVALAYSGSFYAINPDNTIKWVYDDTDISDREIYSVGTVSTDTNDLVYFIGKIVSSDTYTLYILNLDGSPFIAPVNIPNIGVGNVSSVVSANGFAYVSNGEGIIMKYEIDTLTGSSLVVPINLEQITISTDGSTIFAGSSDAGLYSINTTTGATNWNYVPTSVPPELVNQSTISIDSDNTIYFSSNAGSNNKVFAINDDGTPKWIYQTTAKSKGNGISFGRNGEIYYTEGNFLVSLSETAGVASETWRYDTSGAIYDRIAIGHTGVIYVGGVGGGMHAVDPTTGTANWIYQADSATSAPIIGDDGIVYFGSNGGYLYGVKGCEPCAVWPMRGQNIQNSFIADICEITTSTGGGGRRETCPTPLQVDLEDHHLSFNNKDISINYTGLGIVQPIGVTEKLIRTSPDSKEITSANNIGAVKDENIGLSTTSRTYTYKVIASNDCGAEVEGSDASIIIDPSIGIGEPIYLDMDIVVHSQKEKDEEGIKRFQSAIERAVIGDVGPKCEFIEEEVETETEETDTDGYDPMYIIIDPVETFDFDHEESFTDFTIVGWEEKNEKEEIAEESFEKFMTNNEINLANNAYLRAFASRKVSLRFLENIVIDNYIDSSILEYFKEVELVFVSEDLVYSLMNHINDSHYTFNKLSTEKQKTQLTKWADDELDIIMDGIVDRVILSSQAKDDLVCEFYKTEEDLSKIQEYLDNAMENEEFNIYEFGKTLPITLKSNVLKIKNLNTYINGNSGDYKLRIAGVDNGIDVIKEIKINPFGEGVVIDHNLLLGYDGSNDICDDERQEIKSGIYNFYISNGYVLYKTFTDINLTIAHKENIIMCKDDIKKTIYNANVVNGEIDFEYALFGDFTGDGKINSDDTKWIATTFIDIEKRQALWRNLDWNLDGKVDLTDFAMLPYNMRVIINPNEWSGVDQTK